MIQSFGSEGASAHLRRGVFFSFLTDLSEDSFYIRTTIIINIYQLINEVMYLFGGSIVSVEIP